MQKRFIYREEAKCNFCQNWFQVFGDIKFGLNICEDCIYKAMHTQSFKVPTPEGYLYQVYLARRHVSIHDSQTSLMEKLDEFMHTQIRSLMDKWEKIFTAIQKHQQEEDSTFEKKFEETLRSDSQRFYHLTNLTLKDLKEEDVCKTAFPITPLKEKILNLSIKNSSNSKSVKRTDSKKSFRGIENNSSKRTIFLDQKKQECSPFSLHITKMNSSRNLNYSEKDVQENKEFAAKVQFLKNQIGASLEEKHRIEPIKIMKERIFEAIENTNCLNKCIQLVAYRIQNVDMNCYLSKLSWEGVEVVKFVKVGLTDDQLHEILSFIRDKKVETLVLTGNNLTEESFRELLNCEVKSLQNIYIGKNQILPLKVKNEIKQLKTRFNLFV